MIKLMIWNIFSIMMCQIVEVDFSGLIEQKLDSIKKTDLFIKDECDVIMGCLHEVLSGYVSEKWLRKFVEALK